MSESLINFPLTKDKLSNLLAVLNYAVSKAGTIDRGISLVSLQLTEELIALVKEQEEEMKKALETKTEETDNKRPVVRIKK